MHKNEFQKYLQSEKRFSVHTVTAYLNDVNQFLEFIGNAYGELPINKVDHKVIRSWLVYLVSDAQISNNSVNRKLSSIKTYFRFLQLIEVVNVSPTLKVIAPKVSKRLPEFVDQTSMDKFLGVNVFDKSFDGRRDQLVMSCCIKPELDYLNYCLLPSMTFSLVPGLYACWENEIRSGLYL
jgi:integrase/recombinase XerC